MCPAIFPDAAIEWEALGSHARQKVVKTKSRRIRLLELSPGFAEVDWCRSGHDGYVVAGSLRIEFANHAEYAAEGDFISIDGGDQAKHRAIVDAGPVVLLLVEDRASGPP